MTETLSDIRDRIDEIDKDLLRLFNERAGCAERVAEIKSAIPSDEPVVFYRPEREAQILTRVRANNPGPLSADDVTLLFREVISCCLALEQPLTIAYLGPAGTYTEAAAVKQFGHFAKPRSMGSIDEVFREVESGACHYGVVPVENSTEGMVNTTLDCFISSPLKICAEIELPIHHAFLVPNGQDVEDVKIIYSHQQSLAQCRKWLDTHFPGVTREAVASNAEAARLVADRGDAAAIAGEMAAETYSLRPVFTTIEDEPDNTTRFLVVGAQDVGPSGRDKTSILVSTQNEPGALYSILAPFHEHGISLSRIETRPSRSGAWSYVFFIDFDGHGSDEAIRRVLSRVEEVAINVKPLGSYPKTLA